MLTVFTAFIEKNPGIEVGVQAAVAGWSSGLGWGVCSQGYGVQSQARV